MVGIVIIILGIAMSGRLSLEGSGFEGFAYVFISCVMMSFYTVFAADYAKEADPVLLTVILVRVVLAAGVVVYAAIFVGDLMGLNFATDVGMVLSLLSLMAGFFTCLLPVVEESTSSNLKRRLR